MFFWLKPWPMNSQCAPRRLDDRAVAGDRRAVDRQHRRHVEVVEHLEHAPEADAVAVFVPRPVRDVGHRRAAGRRGQHRARHRLVDVPFLDIDDDPQREPRPAGQHQLLALRRSAE
jgi:hypothetical protein